MQEQYQRLEDTVRAYNPGANFSQIRAAFDFAEDAHRGQMRKDGSPFVTHPLAVAQILAEELHLDSESIAAALLHDTIEDTVATHADIARLFSPTVADLVEGVSKLTRVHYTSKEEEQMENLRKMLMAMAKDIRVILIKIADRLHNMRTMEYQTPEKQKQKSFETMEIYAPIAHRLGMQKMKWELEDLSLKYLDPVGYGEITEALEQKSAAYGDFIASVRQQIAERLAEAGISCTVYGRTKHPYSIYRKMYTQNKSLDDVFDLFAFRVIVDTLADCYNVLGIIHDLYHPILGRFKDYIGTPKPNMYQSLHTTVVGQTGIPFEVQIRTREMHEVAEYGIAAHWKYKQNGQGTGDEKSYEWVRRLLENQEGADAEDYIHSLKVDMFADEVFVFTPRGDVINLPAGATPIDFAYTIHSAVGNHMVAAKVNGRIVQFDYTLQSGDVVEVETSQSAHGPSRDWIKIARSNNARSKIRQWFKKERRDENIVNGRASFESELKRCGVTLKELTAEDMLPQVLKKLCYNSLEDMYASIGYGGVTALKLVGRLREEINHILRRRQGYIAGKDTAAPVKTASQPSQRQTHGEQGIIVEGLTGCLVKFAKCCSPVPGDEIVGFITRGYGVSVHRADCPNAAAERHSEADAGRWIRVSWAEKTNESYHTTLEVVAKDRMGLIMDVSTALSTTKTQVSSLNARTTPDGFALVTLNISVPDSEQLQAVMRKLGQISGVLNVMRPTG
ncbi:MAG: bifunctional (p)ppGpp synthetase/guanosine-3',5'-bis(diphosphate) 3'-pyrophosphohydrolase [Oscillospiraceae bacterium]|nr:bifunctional (p)ppGpp synthetase/guanosine-3',5'-bis(diphosphate) 3'-pyrophosphohydrolase [Oscillospiraceae bacterium]